MQHIAHIEQSLPLYGVEATRRLEACLQAKLPTHTLMQRAGLSVAQLAMAVAPHAQRIWVACGPGNNGGDGLEAATHLQRWGKQVTVTWLGTPAVAPPDAASSYQGALTAGVTFSDDAPKNVQLCIDALLGIGTQPREPAGMMSACIQKINACGAPVVAVDLPTGLDANTGAATTLHVKATHTLSLLTLKPGLFTAQGRDASGTVWFDDLLVNGEALHGGCADAQLLAQPAPLVRKHASHKGSFGDVAVIGGAPGMTGAALLAATAALHGGSGRVFVGLLEASNLPVNTSQPELMFRPVQSLDLNAMVVVCGCGGGEAVSAVLKQVLLSCTPLVLDADAINAIAMDSTLQALLSARSNRQAPTVLTPHPLEAARLQDCTVAQIQQDRLAAANRLALRFACTVVLKGSGTVIAAPRQLTAINPTGNARLATAGTGDVLAGMVGAKLAADMPTFQAACEAVFEHGQLADSWPSGMILTASRLSKLSKSNP